jgi:hypothetical protein
MQRVVVPIQARADTSVQDGSLLIGGAQMSEDAPRWASFSSAFSIVLSLASGRIAELGCTPIGEDPQAFVDSGGLRRLETEAAYVAVRRVREAAYPLIFSLFGSEIPRGKKRKRILKRLGDDLARIEKTLGYKRAARNDVVRRYQKRKRWSTRAK